MTTMEKMTVAKMYDAIIDKCEDILSAEELDFLAKRKELHEKKNSSRKPTKDQMANENFKADILDFMVEGKSYTITDIQKGLGFDSNQKVSALVRQLKGEGLVTREEIKGRAYFTKLA